LKHAVREQVLEQLLVSVEPRLKRKPIHGATPGGNRVALTVGEDSADSVGKPFGIGRLVPFPALRVRDADTGVVTDELHRAAARRVDDR